MGNKPSQIGSQKKINGAVDVSKLNDVNLKNGWFGDCQNQAIGVTELPNALEEQFEISWVIKDWSKVSKSAKQIQFHEFRGGPLTNHLWTLKLEIIKTERIKSFLTLKGIEGKSDFIEAQTWTNLFLSDRNSRIKPGQTSFYYKIKSGQYFCKRWDWPTVVENDTIRVHSIFRVKIPFKPELMKHTLMTAQCLPALTSSNEILLQDFGTLFHSKDYADFKLVVGNVQIPAHKCILSARSPVFATMIATQMKEKAESRVVIEDFKPEIVNAMLGFMYTGKITVKGVSMEDLLLIAEKYQLPQLRAICESSLISELGIHNAARFVKLAHLVESALALKTRSIDFIKRNLEEITKTAGYQELAKSSPELLTEILLWKN